MLGGRSRGGINMHSLVPILALELVSIEAGNRRIKHNLSIMMLLYIGKYMEQLL